MNCKVLIVHYKTYELTKRAIESVRKFYPKINLTIVDGSGFDASSAWLYNTAKQDGNMTLMVYPYNVHHGPGMDAAIRASEHRYVLLLDSDAELIRPNVIEDMFEYVGDTPFHMVGNELYVDENGLTLRCHKTLRRNTPEDRFKYKYIHPSFALLDRDAYVKYAPFVKHGAPCVSTAMDLYEKDKSDLFINFFPGDKRPGSCVKHDWAGTRNTYGIQL